MACRILMPIFEDYGGVWAKAVEDIATVLNSDLPPEVQLRRVMEFGFFSQFTSNPLPAFNEGVVCWLEGHLVARWGISLQDIPAELNELDVVPQATQIRKYERLFSPDLLRYVDYSMQMTRAWPVGPERAEVLEIGSGYGGLARTLRCLRPNTRIWLADIPESLRCAEIYLQKAFPHLRIAWLDAQGNGADADFVLVPAGEAASLLPGRRFDLAINVWSFGEMPNQFVNTWLGLIQEACQIDWLFTINSFMAPVTPAAQARTQTGAWLPGLDAGWAVEDFEINPAVHRCPLMRNFPKGIALLLRRVYDDSAVARLRDEAAAEAAKVLNEDWVAIAAERSTASSPGRPERMLDGAIAGCCPTNISSKRLLALTDYVGHFDIDAGVLGPFFRLWNDWRMNRNPRTGALLVAYLAMVGKTNLDHRCTKEELLLLEHLPRLPLHKEYAAFMQAEDVGSVLHHGKLLTAQEACDLALEFKKASHFSQAEELWLSVAAAHPNHGDCWFQLSLLAEQQSQFCLAAVYSAHAVHLGCHAQAENALRMRDTFVDSRKSIFSRLKSFNEKADPAVALCHRYFAGDTRLAFIELAKALRVEGKESHGAALEQAALCYDLS